MKTVYLLIVLSLVLAIFLLSSSEPSYPYSLNLLILVNSKPIPIPDMYVNGFQVKDQVIKTTPGKTLGDFFNAWGVKFSKTCIFQYCNEDMKMFVNEIDNFDFNEYYLRNNDEIIILVITH